MAISYYQAITGWGAAANTSPATSGSFTAQAGDVILVSGADVNDQNQVLTITGTGAYTVINPPGTFNDADFDTWQTAANLSATPGAQTITLACGDPVNFAFAVGAEYSGVASVTAAENSIFPPGAGVGAVLGVSVVVPVGSVLVAFCVNVASSTRTPTATAGITRDSGNVSFAGGSQCSYCTTEYAGDGSAIQPAFTVGAGGGVQCHTVTQFLLSLVAPITAATAAPSVVSC